MPIPSKYKEIAIRILPFQWHFLAMSGAGILLALLSILISVKSELNLLFLSGVGFFLVLWGWGLFLVVNWYGKTTKITMKFPRVIVLLAEWFSTFFLNIWFLVGSIGIIVFIWQSI